MRKAFLKSIKVNRMKQRKKKIDSLICNCPCGLIKKYFIVSKFRCILMCSCVCDLISEQRSLPLPVYPNFVNDLPTSLLSSHFRNAVAFMQSRLALYSELSPFQWYCSAGCGWDQLLASLHPLPIPSAEKDFPLFILSSSDVILRYLFQRTDFKTFISWKIPKAMVQDHAHAASSTRYEESTQDFLIMWMS